MSAGCVICGGPLEPQYPAVLDVVSGETFAIERCAACQLGHTTPQPDDLAPYYGTQYHGRRHGFTARYSDARRLRCLRDVAPAPGRLLDVGCGDGSFLLAAREKGWSVVGTELNPALARAAGLDVYSTVPEVSAHGPFDVITFWHTLEHMKDPRAMLGHARSLLAPNGVVLVAVPNAGSTQAVHFKEDWFHLDVPRHLFHFSDTGLEAVLRANELSVVRRWSQEIEIGVFGWIQTFLNRMLSKPNALYAWLTGRPVRASDAAVSTVLGSFLFLFSTPLELVAIARRKGATLVVAARAS